VHNLVIASGFDYTPLAEKKAYVGRMEKAKLVVIDDARHAVPVEKPEQFNTVLEAFLQAGFVTGRKTFTRSG